MPFNDHRLKSVPLEDRSWSEENFQYTRSRRSFHGMYTRGQWIFFAYQTINIERAFSKQINRWCKATATRPDNAQLVDHYAGCVDLTAAVKG